MTETRAEYLARINSVRLGGPARPEPPKRADGGPVYVNHALHIILTIATCGLWLPVYLLLLLRKSDTERAARRAGG